MFAPDFRIGTPHLKNRKVIEICDVPQLTGLSS